MDRRYRWAVVLAVLLVAVGVGVVSYNAGVSHGLGIAATAGGAGGAANQLPPFRYGPYGWGYGFYRPWGFGFFGPFLFVLFWFLVFRLLFWGFRGRRWHYAGPCDSPWFDDWHRRAHERMSGQTTSPGGSGASA